MTEKPEEQEQEEVQPTQAEVPVEPALAHPKYHDKPAWHEEETSKWPLLIVLAVVVIMVTAALWVGLSVPDWATTKRVETPGTVELAPADPGPPAGLSKGWVYKVSAATPLCQEAGGDVKGPGVKVLPVDAEIGILRVEMVGPVKWYQVESAGAGGWVSSASLEGQNLRLVRTVN